MFSTNIQSDVRYSPPPEGWRKFKEFLTGWFKKHKHFQWISMKTFVSRSSKKSF